jgi:hypothetical protein
MVAARTGEAIARALSSKPKTPQEGDGAGKKASPKQSLAEALAAVLDEEDDTLPCLTCHL